MLLTCALTKVALLAGSTRHIDGLFAEFRDGLRARPYDLVFVANGYQLRQAASRQLSARRAAAICATPARPS